MPTKTTRKSAAKRKVHPHHVPFAVVFLISIVAVLTFALLYIWREFPRLPPPTPSKIGEPIPPTPAIPGEPATSTPSIPTEPVAPVPTTPVRETPTGMMCDSLNFICVDEAVKDSTLTSPFTVMGSAIAFENTVNWRLLDGKGQVLETGYVTAAAPDIGKPGNFTIRAFMLSVPTTSTGTLEVLEYSAKDGAPIHVVKIPVQLQRTTMTSRFFMLPPTIGTDCSVVTAVENVVGRSALPVETAIRALLKFGPSMSSKRSAIPERTELVSLSVSGGLAKIVFSPELENYGGGSCNAGAIRAQIEQTLKQFSSVDRVEISVVGKSAAETLQP